jgi:ankyrin repeat protein
MGNKASNGELIKAAKRGDEPKLLSLIQMGANINRADEYGETALIYAAQGTSVEIVSKLLEHGADVNWKGERRWTPLIYAVSRNWTDGKNRTEIAKKLIENGADIDAYDTRGESVFHFAVRSRNIDIINYLIEKGVRMNVLTHGNSTPLMDAVSYPNNLEVVKVLVDAGADLNVFPLNLFLAAVLCCKSGGGFETLKFLKESGMQYFEHDSNGNSMIDMLRNNFRPPHQKPVDVSEVVEFLENWRDNLTNLTKDT